uniref:RIIa domain-containing protein n=1 Tax=Kryptolebias marmoratus TaxID=37003 RepID=A0A3Q3A921_KRYMA
MSVPFSNAHLRVPRGFGTILEGLAREVLRDQPEDIPAYAARYFDALLKQREESGLDPAEWAAKLEDRFHNSYAFQNIRQSPRTVEKSQPDNISEEKEITTEEEEEHVRKMTDSEVRQKSQEMEKEETFSLSGSADQTAADLEEEDRPDEPEESTIASVNKVDKVIWMPLSTLYL